VTEHDETEGYDGEATVEIDGREPRSVHTALAARFDPLAGHVVWTGRVSVELAPRTTLLIRTPHGSGTAETIEQDPWGNTRVRGIGRPPFPVELLDAVDAP
jgi:hypothetical protein